MAALSRASQANDWIGPFKTTGPITVRYGAQRVALDEATARRVWGLLSRAVRASPCNLVSCARLKSRQHPDEVYTAR